MNILYWIGLVLALVLGACKMVGDTRQGWAVLAAMTAIFVVLTLPCVGAEQAGNPKLAARQVVGAEWCT